MKPIAVIFLAGITAAAVSYAIVKRMQNKTASMSAPKASSSAAPANSSSATSTVTGAPAPAQPTATGGGAAPAYPTTDQLTAAVPGANMV